jgi:hypothetical protein
LPAARSRVRENEKPAIKGKTICAETDMNLSLVCLYC